jgi:hypothetical protein
MDHGLGGSALTTGGDFLVDGLGLALETDLGRFKAVFGGLTIFFMGFLLF